MIKSVFITLVILLLSIDLFGRYREHKPEPWALIINGALIVFGSFALFDSA